MMDGAYVIDVDDRSTISSTKEHILGDSGTGVPDSKFEFPLFYPYKQQICDKEVFEPNVLSIGPRHYRQTSAATEMQQIKWESCSYVLRLNHKRKMRDYIEGIEELEPDIKSWYANGIQMCSYELLKTMLLLDGCFVLFVLHGMEGIAVPTEDSSMSNVDQRRLDLEKNFHASIIQVKVDADQTIENNSRDDGSRHDDDAFYTRQWYTSFFSRDLLILNNQIPFFVVTKMYELVTDGKVPFSVLTGNIADSIEDLLDSYPKAIQKFVDQLKEFHHLLHLCHMYFKPNDARAEIIQIHEASQVLYPLNSSRNKIFGKKNRNDSYYDEENASEPSIGWHSAAEYHRAGIEFAKREFHIDSPHCLLDIRFRDGMMEIPCLTIDPNTHCLFRNLVAFEQTCPQFRNYMTAYVVFDIVSIRQY